MKIFLSAVGLIPVKSGLLLILNCQFLIFNSTAQPPDWLWVKSIGGIINDYGNSLAVDAAGNIYTTGVFSDTVDFDPGAGVFNLISIGAQDIFISKSDSSGNFIWAKAMGGISYDASNSIAINPSGSGAIYTTGRFRDTVDFDPGAGVFNLISAGGDDIFISKLDSSGNFVWAKRIGGTLYFDDGYSIAIDPEGNGAVYTTGLFQGTVDFDPGAGVFNLTGDLITYDIFISKLDFAGNFVWAKRMGSSTGDEEGSSIAIDTTGSGAVYTIGQFNGTADFDPGAGIFNLTWAGANDIFISKLDSLGNFAWAKQIGGTESDGGRSIAIDPLGSGDVYTTGFFSEAVDFDPGPGVFILTSGGGDDIYISKLNSSGNFIWAKSMVGIGVNYDGGSSIAIDPSGSGNIYTTGSFSGTADFDPGAGIFNLTSAGMVDIFICKLDSSGNFEWSKAMGGPNNDLGNSITIDASGNVYMTGLFASPSVNFGSTILTNVDNTGNSGDLFIARLDTSIATGINKIENFGKDILLSPNPLSLSTIISFLLSQSQVVSLKIFDVNGRLIITLADKIFDAGDNHFVFNAENFNAGIYFLKIQAEEFLKTEKLIITK